MSTSESGLSEGGTEDRCAYRKANRAGATLIWLKFFPRTQILGGMASWNRNNLHGKRVDCFCVSLRPSTALEPDIRRRPRDVCFTPQSRRRLTALGCPLSAKSRTVSRAVGLWSSKSLRERTCWRHGEREFSRRCHLPCAFPRHASRTVMTFPSGSGGARVAQPVPMKRRSKQNDCDQPRHFFCSTLPLTN